MLQIHKASAGSGKTFTLTRRYLQLLLGQKATDGPNKGKYRLRPLGSYGYGKAKHHGAILAVTFTNKATGEMTSRIITELAKLASNGSAGKSDYLNDFIEIFDTDADTLARHASMALRDVLFNFSWFNVSTIDSFFQRVLGTFTRELDLSPSHSVEIDEKYPLFVAVGDMFSSLRERPGEHLDETELRNRRFLRMWLEMYMKRLALEGGNFNILCKGNSLFADLVHCIELFYSEKYRMNAEAVDSYLANPERIVNFARALGEDPASEALANRCTLQAQNMLSDPDPLLSQASLTFLKKVCDKQYDKLTQKNLENLNDPLSFFKKEDKKKQRRPESLPLMQALLTDLSEVIRRKSLADTLLKWIYYMGLFGQMQRFLEKFRKENDTLLLSDTTNLLHRIISEEETPFIYERMGTTIRHYLIDEFQDTSLMQWENLRSLVLESLSTENDNLIIGDEKQCIYRFRNSDPRLLGEKVEQLINNRFPGAVDMHGIDIQENCNWRSAPAVVTFNNTVFMAMARKLDAIFATEEISHTYAALVQMFPAKHTAMPGYVKAMFIQEQKANEPDRQSEQAQEKTADTVTEQEKFDSKYNTQLLLIRNEISRQLQSGYHPADIAILVRKKRQGEEVIGFLMDMMENDPSWQHGALPIMSADSMAVGLSPAVRMIVTVLRMVSDPELTTGPNYAANATDNTSGTTPREPNASFLRYRLIHRFELSRHEKIMQLQADGTPATNPDGSPAMRPTTDAEALAIAVAATAPGEENTDERQRAINADLRDLMKMDSPTLPALTERIIAKLLSADTLNKENAFITAFQDLVLDFCSNGNNNIREFLQWWDRTGKNINVQAPDGLDAISVMTVHKAKGLGFKCVHVPYFSFDIVSYHTPMLRSISWYTINPTYFPTISPELIPPMMPLPNLQAVIEHEAFAEEGKHWRSEQVTDALNVAYVALTRAKNELCIYDDKYIGESAAAKPNIGNLLFEAITSLTPEAIGTFNMPPDAQAYLSPLSHILRKVHLDGTEVLEEEQDSQNLLYVAEAGEPTTQPNDNAADTACNNTAACNETEQQDPFSDMANGYYVCEHPEIFACTDFEDLIDFDIENERHRGIFLHSVLSRVNSINDLKDAVDGQAYRYGIDEHHKLQCLATLQEAMADERIALWFDGCCGALTERTISFGKENRRPDRIILMPDGTVAVIDYKFGQQHRRKYHKQVKHYCHMLADAGYGPNIKGYLWYPTEREIIEVQ